MNCHRLVPSNALMGSLPTFGACGVASIHTMKPDAFYRSHVASKAIRIDGMCGA